MVGETSYLWGWAIYLIAALIFYASSVRLTRWISLRFFRQVLLVAIAVLLFTPTIESQAGGDFMLLPSGCLLVMQLFYGEDTGPLLIVLLRIFLILVGTLAFIAGLRYLRRRRVSQ